MASQQITLDDFYLAIETALKAEFPVLKSVVWYPESPEQRRAMPLPAVILAITEAETAEENPGTGQYPTDLRIEAEVVVHFKDGATAKRRVRELAISIASFVHLNRFGLAVGAADVINCQESDFRREQEQNEIWAIEWTQNLRFGLSVWDDETAESLPAGVTPSLLQTLASWSPNIGIGHEADYLPIDDVQPPPPQV